MSFWGNELELEEIMSGANYASPYFHSKGTDDIPTDSPYVDPADLDPWLTGGRSAVLKEVDEPAIRHATNAASYRRVVYDVDNAFLVNVSKCSKRATSARVDAWFSAHTANQNVGGRSMDGNDQSDSCAKAVFRRSLGRSSGSTVGLVTLHTLSCCFE
jgi:hypothetical protein